MRWKRSRAGILRDNDAQAITEFVIIIPVVLFMWLSIMQTMIVAQATQLASYGAFAAARSYATSFGKFQDHDEAFDRARNSATLVMAPVSHAQYGELRPAAHQGGFDLVVTIRNIVGGLPLIVQELYGIAEGFAVAYLYRIKDFQCANNGGVVNVSFDYLVPVAIPGFIELWTYLFDRGGGGQLAHHAFDVGLILADPSGLNNAINQVFDALAQIESLLGSGSGIGGLAGQFSAIISGVYSFGYIGNPFNVRISAKSVCGFEPWNGVVRTDDIEPYCEGELDENMQECLDQMNAQQEALNEATAVQSNLCHIADQRKDVYVARSNTWANAVSANQTCRQNAINNNQNPDIACATEQQAEDDARFQRDVAHNEAENAMEDCEDAGEEVQNNSDFSNIEACQDAGIF